MRPLPDLTVLEAALERARRGFVRALRCELSEPQAAAATMEDACAAANRALALAPERWRPEIALIIAQALPRAFRRSQNELQRLCLHLACTDAEGNAPRRAKIWADIARTHLDLEDLDRAREAALNGLADLACGPETTTTALDLIEILTLAGAWESGERAIADLPEPTGLQCVRYYGLLARIAAALGRAQVANHALKQAHEAAGRSEFRPGSVPASVTALEYELTVHDLLGHKEESFTVVEAIVRWLEFAHARHPGEDLTAALVEACREAIRRCAAHPGLAAATGLRCRAMRVSARALAARGRHVRLAHPVPD